MDGILDSQDYAYAKTQLLKQGELNTNLLERKKLILSQCYPFVNG